MALTDKSPAIDQGCEQHDPALYRPTAVATGVQTLEDVGDEQLTFYREHGYVVVENALTPNEINQSLATLDRLVDQEWAGTMYESAVGDDLDALTPEQRRDRVRKLAFYGPEAIDCGLLVDHPGLLRVVRLLMGGREPQLFQTMTLLKPPRVGREKPWHQDHAYFDLNVADRIVGIWIALDEATIDNGCMQLLDGGHHLGPMHHWKRRDWQICDTEIMGKTSVAAPLRPGGALFFDSLLPHGTPTNHSPNRRRAMQFHYAPADSRAVPTEQRLAVFGTEGKDVTC